MSTSRSVMQVTCFAVAVNDIVKQFSGDVQYAFSIDDLIIFVSARNSHFKQGYWNPSKLIE